LAVVEQAEVPTIVVAQGFITQLQEEAQALIVKIFILLLLPVIPLVLVQAVQQTQRHVEALVVQEEAAGILLLDHCLRAVALVVEILMTVLLLQEALVELLLEHRLTLVVREVEVQLLRLIYHQVMVLIQSLVVVDLDLVLQMVMLLVIQERLLVLVEVVLFPGPGIQGGRQAVLERLD
jgi:hypothetical protein